HRFGGLPLLAEIVVERSRAPHCPGSAEGLRVEHARPLRIEASAVRIHCYFVAIGHESGSLEALSAALIAASIASDAAREEIRGYQRAINSLQPSPNQRTL